MRSTLRASNLLIGLLIVALTGVSASVSRSAGGSCLTNSDTAARYLTRWRQLIHYSDSAGLAPVGLNKVDTTRVTLVTDTAVCKPAVAAYKRATGDTTVALDAAYVLRIGTRRLVVIHPDRGAGHFTTMIVLNAANYAFLSWLEG